MKKTLTLFLLLFAVATATSHVWENVGPMAVTTGGTAYTSIKFDPNGTPYLAYKDIANGGKATVKKFDGTSWVNVGLPGFSTGTASYITLAFDYFEAPCVAYSDGSNGGKATVMTFNGEQWENLGTPGFSEGAAAYTSIASGPAGTYVAYQDAANGNKVSIMQLNGDWEYLGTPGFSANPATNICIAMAGPSPAVAYISSTNNKVTCKRWNGTQMTTLGPADFSAGNTDYLSLAVLPTGRAIVAYRDNENGGKATVMKLVATPGGLTWENVGVPGFSAAAANYTSIVVDASGTPYVAYSDEAYNAEGSIGQATVMKFNGTIWENVGTPGFSAGPALYTSLALDSAGVPYVAYANGLIINDANQASVKKFATLQTPQLAPAYCGITAQLNDNLLATTLEGAVKYMFRVSDGTTTNTVVRTDNIFRINMLPSYAYNTTYTVEVSAFINNAWGNFGSACTVTTPVTAMTQVRTQDCGTTVPNFGTSIYANTVNAATQYRFRIINGPNIQTIDKSTSYFKLNQLAAYQYDTTYTIDVAVEVNGSFGPYGFACNVSTPSFPVTQLRGQDCGTTLASLGANIYANAVPAATQYRFRIINGPNVQTIDRPNTYFRMNQLAMYEYGLTYTVDVAVEINGVFGAYGPFCYVTTPMAVTQLNAASCGTTVASFSTNLYAIPVNLAEGYRFRIINGPNVQSLDVTSSYFRLNQFAVYQYNAAYIVAVSVKINGVYGPYGQACIVNTPAPLTQLRAQDCGTTVARFGTNLYADDVLLAQGYRFRVTNGAAVNIVDRPNRNFRISMLPSYAYNTTYIVEVAVLIDGVWGGYGQPCEVSTPVSGTRQNMANDEEAVRQVTAFPNPFETSFILALQTGSNEAVTIQAYDLTGKMLDNRTVAPEELSDLRIGENYAAGIYSVIVTQGSYTKIVKMAKK